MAYETGRRAVEMVREDLTPSKIMTRKAFENAIGSIPPSADRPMRPTISMPLPGISAWSWMSRTGKSMGYDVPLLVNLQPAGEYLGEDYHRAGGVPAVVAELIAAGKIHEDAMTANGKTIGENCKDKFSWDRDVIKEYAKPLKTKAGFKMLSGNLFDSAIMKTCVISRGIPRALSVQSEGPRCL